MNKPQTNIIEKNFFKTFIDEKKLAVLVFNKDSANFLRLYNEGFKNGNYSIKYLIDFTLTNRPDIFEKAEKLISGDKIITNFEDFKAIVNKKAIDLVVSFDGGFERSESEDFVFDEIPTILENILKDYKEKKKNEKAAEYNYRWDINIMGRLIYYLVDNEIYVFNAYLPANPMIFLNEIPHDFRNKEEKYYLYFPNDIMDTFDINKILYKDLEKPYKKLRNIKIRFVLGTDYAVGKSSFIINQMIKNNSYSLFSDRWFILNSDKLLPTLRIDKFSLILKGLLMTKLKECYMENPNKEIFFKHEGRLEDFAYGFPKDRGMYWGYFHKFFKDHKFIIITKDTEKIEHINDTLDTFKTRMDIKDDVIEIYQSDNKGNFSLLG